MSRSRILLTLALAATLATPCVYGAPREERTRPAGLVEHFWGFINSIWAELGFGLDPHGAAAADTDLGHGLDPYGIKSSEPGGESPTSPEGDIGMNIDPHG